MAQLDLSLPSVSLKGEVDAALTTLIDALGVAVKFTAFLNPSVASELAAAVKVLTTVKALVDKLP